ncbi:MAG: ABC transporter substrate-binding protein [Deltaproteobacteria bacterium]|nr:ABC transporter substrate-binding protein [Deltaproteobacteria bacterium]
MRKSGFRLCIVGTAICMIFLFLSASAVLAASDDTVKVGMRYDISTVNMIEMKLGSDIPVVLLMHESLIMPDPITGDRIGGLAKSFEILENGKQIKVTIYQGAKFHTGDPVTVHDVKFTYDACADPQNGNMMAGALDEIEDIEIVDDYTLIFHFWESYAPWEELMWLGICSKKYYEEAGSEKFRSHPVGSGSLRFVERRIGEHVILEAVEGYPFYENEAYSPEMVDFKYLKIMTIPDDMSRLAMLETGELDLVGEILPHQLKRLKRNKHVKIKKSDQVPSLIGIACLPNTDPVMMDRNLGLAIRHGINRRQIVDKIFLGEGYPLYMYASKAELGYDPNVSYEFDPEKARAFLEKSNYKKGTPLTFTYTSMVPNSALIAALIQKYLQQVGITIKLQQLEEGTAATYTRNRDKRLGHMRLYQWPGSRDPNLRLIMSVLSTSDYASVTDRPRKEEMDKLIIAQAREMDKAKRAGLIKQIHGIMAYDSVGALLFGLNMIYGMSDRVDYTWTPKEAYYPHLQRIKIVK